jgi:hypothetical protein
MLGLCAILTSSLSACNPEDTAKVTSVLDRATELQAKAEHYHLMLQTACRIGMGVAPMVAPGVVPYLVAGCGTEAAIAKLALDPSSLEWVKGLVASVVTL